MKLSVLAVRLIFWTLTKNVMEFQSLVCFSMFPLYCSKYLFFLEHTKNM